MARAWLVFYDVTEILHDLWFSVEQCSAVAVSHLIPFLRPHCSRNGITSAKKKVVGPEFGSRRIECRTGVLSNARKCERKSYAESGSLCHKWNMYGECVCVR